MNKDEPSPALPPPPPSTSQSSQSPPHIHGVFPAAAASCRIHVEVDTQGVLWFVSSPAPEPAVPSQQQEQEKEQQKEDQDVYDRELLCELMDLRSSFDSIPRSHYSAARRESNHYEALGAPPPEGGNPFLNRSAVKLANLNYLMDAASEKEERQCGTFLDLCGGPGGFCEYLLSSASAEGREVRGWGMTLEDCDCPWDYGKLKEWLVEDEEHAEINDSEDDGSDRDNDEEEEEEGGSKLQPKSKKRRKTSPTREQSLRLCYGKDGTGDLCRPENVHHLERFLPGLVDLVVADGGFAEARARFDQEAQMLPLLISEASAMVQTLREGGRFVCKFFDVTLPATVQLVRLLSLLFERVALVKPVTSRPASSEKYFLAMGFRGQGHKEREEAETLLERMLARAVAGHTDGLQVLGEGVLAVSLRGGGGSSGSGSGSSGSDSSSKAFVRWLRAVNDKLMQCQVKACHAILEKVDVEENEGERDENKEAILDVDYYRQAWGLDKIKSKN